MLKLLIVDDEPIIRNGIHRIIEWEKYGYVICGEAEDGPSAVAAITLLKPDLVLLDLHLPGFSGLEVIRKVTQEGMHPHFLVLSGYAEFEYAKEAINLDVNGYIVKPIDEALLLGKIISIAQKIKREAPEEHLKIQFMEIMEGVYREETCGPFIFGRGYVQAVFVSVETETQRMKPLNHFFQNNICRTLYYREFTVFLFENTPETAIKHLLENLCAWLEKAEVWSDITMGSRCTEEIERPGEGIRETCREAERLMEQTFFYRDKKYLSPEDAIPAIQNDIPRPDARRDNDEAVTKICSFIQVIDHQKIRAFFLELENYFFTSGKTPQEIRQECMALTIEVRGDLLKKIPALKEHLGSGKETLDAIMKLRRLGSVIDAMTENCLRISDSLPLLSADASFQRIISYVKNNYNDELKLETLGQLFNYNCAYLGKRFKEFTGKSFHTYLDMLRIDAAKNLLRNTDMKVYEISVAAGYTNTDYFYSKFKKYAGESPLIFRKKAAGTP